MIYGIIYVVIAIIMFFVIFAYYCKKYKEEDVRLTPIDAWLDRRGYDSNILVYSALWPLIIFVVPFNWIMNKIAKHYEIKD